MRPTSSSRRSGTPSSSASQTVALEVATPGHREARRAMRSDSSRTNQAAVEPVPRPEHHAVLDHLERPRRGGALGEIGGASRRRHGTSGWGAAAL